MKKTQPVFLAAGVLFAVFCLGASNSALAHPHSFVEARVAFVFDEEGLAGFRQKWIIDEMTTLTVLEAIAENGDGKLDAKEIAAIKETSMGSLKGYGFFTDARIDGERFKPEWIQDFHASLDDGKLIYEFLLPCHVKAASVAKEILLAIYDESFYSYIAYGAESVPTIDPAKDPQFANTSAEPNPDDFERFSKAVGLGGYASGVRLEGPVEKFDIESEVRLAPELAYFFGQISPEAFVVRFRRK